MEFNISESEQLIMEILWNHQTPATIAETNNILQKENNIFWKRQTINTFLARLIKKDLVIQQGRMYTYAITKSEFKKLRAEKILQEEYGGSLKNFIAALSGSQNIDEDEYGDLMKYMENYK